MPRFIILGVVLAIAFTLYSLVDAAMTDQRRIRGVSKPFWVVICVLLPVIGGILWFTVGKGDGKPKPRQSTPDDDHNFGVMSPHNVDERIADLESQLRALDEEVYPGEDATSSETDDAETDEVPPAPEQTSAPDTPVTPEEREAPEDGTEK